MAVLPVLRWPDPRLTQPAQPIDGITPAIRTLAEDMLATMYASSGRGLAAPQVGVLQRMFVMDATWKSGPPSPQVFLNPEILWQSDVVARGAEGCLSIPGPSPLIARAQALRLSWTGLNGARLQARLAGFAAICVQHEMDHLNGVLTLDHLSPQDRAMAEGQIQ